MKVQSKFLLLSASLFLAIVSSAIAGGGGACGGQGSSGGQGCTIVSQREVQSDVGTVTEYVLRTDAGELVTEYRDNDGRITGLTKYERRHLRKAERLNKRAQKQVEKAEKAQEKINGLRNRNSDIAHNLGGRQVVRYETMGTISTSSPTDSHSYETETSVSVSREVNHENDQFAKPAGGCPNGMIDTGDGMCYGANLFQDGECADKGKSDGGQGKSDGGQGKSDGGQGKTAIHQAALPEVVPVAATKPTPGRMKPVHQEPTTLPEVVVEVAKPNPGRTKPVHQEPTTLPEVVVEVAKPNPGRTKPVHQEPTMLPEVVVVAKNPTPGRKTAQQEPKHEKAIEKCTLAAPCDDRLAQKETNAKAAEEKMKESSTVVGEEQNLIDPNLVDFAAKLKKSSKEKHYITTYSRGGEVVGIREDKSKSSLKIKIKGSKIDERTAKNLMNDLNQADESFDARVKARKALYETSTAAN